MILLIFIALTYVRAFSFDKIKIEYDTNLPKSIISVLPSYLNDSTYMDSIRNILEENGYPFYRIYTQDAKVLGNTILLKLNIYVDNPVFIKKERLYIGEKNISNVYINDILVGNFLYNSNIISNHKKDIEKVSGVKIDSIVVFGNKLIYYGHSNTHSHFEGSLSYENELLRGYMNIHLRYLFCIPLGIDFVWNGVDTLNSNMLTSVYIDKIPHFYFGAEIFSSYNRDSSLVIWKYGVGSIYNFNNIRISLGVYRKDMFTDTLRNQYNGVYGIFSYKNFRDTVNISVSYDTLYYFSSFFMKRFIKEHIGAEFSLFYINANNEKNNYYLYPFYNVIIGQDVSNQICSFSPLYSLRDSDFFMFFNILFRNMEYHSYSYGIGFRYYKFNTLFDIAFSSDKDITDYRDIGVYVLIKYYFSNM